MPMTTRCLAGDAAFAGSRLATRDPMRPAAASDLWNFIDNTLAPDSPICQAPHRSGAALPTGRRSRSVLAGSISSR